MDEGTLLSKADKLRIAGYSAPLVRAVRTRPIKVVDATGAVIRETTLAEVQKKIHEHAGIEFGVEDGKREKLSACTYCGILFEQKPTGKRLKLCPKCRVIPCNMCGAPTTDRTSACARNTGCKAYCSECSPKNPSKDVKVKDVKVKKPRTKAPPLPCTTCGAASTYWSSRNARAHGYSPYCEAHKGGKS